MAPKERDEPPQQQILFVDVNQANERGVKTQIRSHLMHEHVRQKRIQQDQYLKNAAQFPHRFITSTQRDVPTQQRWGAGVYDATSVKKGPRRRGEDRAAQEAVLNCLQHSGQPPSAIVNLAVGSPLSSLSSLRRDSFASYPLKLDRDGHDLVDFWLTEFPKMTLLSLSPGIEAIFAPTRNVFFPLAMSSPAAFETTVLHFAALHRAKLRGVENDRLVNHHRNKSLRMTQDRVNSAVLRGDKTTDGDLVAVLSLGIAEGHLGDQFAASIHLQGARQLIRSRRERGQLPQNQKLDLLFNWYNIMSQYSTHTSANVSARVFEELKSDFENFLTVLDAFRDLAISQHSLGTQRLSPRLSSPSRLTPALCRILASFSPTDPSYTMFPFQMSRFLALLHIHMALFFYRHDLNLAENYLKTLSIRTIEVDLEYRPNPVFLLVWTILSDPVLHDSLRGWYVNRISVVFKLLSLETRHSVGDYLLGLLDLREDDCGDLVIPNIDKKKLEQEVLGVGGGFFEVSP